MWVYFCRLPYNKKNRLLRFSDFLKSVMHLDLQFQTSLYLHIQNTAAFLWFLKLDSHKSLSAHIGFKWKRNYLNTSKCLSFHRYVLYSFNAAIKERDKNLESIDLHLSNPHQGRTVIYMHLPHVRKEI